MDGVLIDSEPLWHAAEIEVFATVGIVLTLEMCLETTGRRVDEVVGYWYSRRPWTEPSKETVAVAVVDEMERKLRAEAELKEGARQALDFVAGKDVRVALASSSHLRLIDTVLARFALRNRFDVVHSAEEEPFGKPHPAVYLSTARRLGVDPASCLAIEDSVAGARSAVAAGMRCIAIPETPDPVWSAGGPAVVVLESLAELDEDVWERVRRG